MQREDSTPRYFLPDHLVSYETTRSGGPGGQGVNTTDSAVRARVNIWRLLNLTYEQRRRVVEKLRHQLTGEGELIAKIQTTRSQRENKLLAKIRLESVISSALIVPEIRIPTKPTKSSRERRLREKKNLTKKKLHRRADLEN